MFSVRQQAVVSLQRGVPLRVLDVGRGAVLQQQGDQPAVPLGRGPVERGGVQLVCGVGVGSVLKQHQGNL